MKQVEEAVALYILEKQLEATEQDIEIFTEYLTPEQIAQLPQTVQNEINYIREKLEGTDVTTKLPSDCKYEVATGEGKNICYLPSELADGKKEAYIYDEQSASVYKVEPTIIWGVEMHGYEYGNLLTTQTGLLERAKNNKVDGTKNEEIKLTTETIYGDYTKATIKVTINYEGEVSKIIFQEEEIGIPEKGENGYEIELEVGENTNYTVIVYDEQEKYQMANIKIDEISTDLDIYNAEQLVAFRERVNKGATYEGRTIRVMDDIDLSSVCGEEIGNWIPIGNYGETNTLIFKGTFEGNNYTISNLHINNETGDYQGLFGYSDGGKINNLKIENANITANGGVGGIVGNLINGEITNCITTTTTSKIIGTSYVGGISGYIESTTITNCGNNIEIEVTSSNGGGIVGRAIDSEIIRVYNKANINGGRLIGGIVGYTAGTDDTKNKISYCYNIGEITGLNCVGGIDGYSADYTKIFNSYNSGNVKSTNVHSNGNTNTGGITGVTVRKTNVFYCYNLGVVTNTGGGRYTGGIAGQNSSYNGTEQDVDSASTIQYCYNTKNVISNGTRIGGFVGSNAQYSYLKDSYVLDTVTVTIGTTESTTATASADIGSSSDYLGKIIGSAYSTSTTYVDNIGTLEANKMPTVYNVVNGLSDEDSEYWSKSDLNAPKLKWEESN